MEPPTCAVVAGSLTRAHQVGKGGTPTGEQLATVLDVLDLAADYTRDQAATSVRVPSPVQIPETVAALMEPMAAVDEILICTLICLYAPGDKVTLRPLDERMAVVISVVSE